MNEISIKYNFMDQKVLNRKNKVQHKLNKLKQLRKQKLYSKNAGAASVQPENKGGNGTD